MLPYQVRSLYQEVTLAYSKALVYALDFVIVGYPLRFYPTAEFTGSTARLLLVRTPSSFLASLLL